jgi:hypothetical protein
MGLLRVRGLETFLLEVRVMPSQDKNKPTRKDRLRTVATDAALP